MGFSIGGGAAGPQGPPGVSSQTPWASDINGNGKNLTNVNLIRSGLLFASANVIFGMAASNYGSMLSSSAGVSSNYNAAFVDSNSNADNTQSNTSLPAARLQVGGGSLDWGGANALALGYVAAGGSMATPAVLLRVTPSGNVGIGTPPTISGTGKLHCSGDTARIVDASRTPANSAAPGNDGEICFDNGFVYVHTGGSWRRAALTTF